MLYKTLNFLPSLVWLKLLFSLSLLLCLSHSVTVSLPRYFLFSVTWMSLFSMERTKSSESRHALFSAMLFLLLFCCSDSQMDSASLPDLSVSLSSRLCQCVCRSAHRAGKEKVHHYTQRYLQGFLMGIFSLILHAVKWLNFSPSLSGVFPNSCRCTQGQA